MNRNFLRSALVNESRAYGFTIAFWGSGALLVKYNSLPTLEQALLYGLGAITGFALLTLYAYRSTLREVNKQESDIMVLSMIHYLGALLPITATYYTGQIASPYNFFLTGVSVSVLYNLGMVVEEVLSERGRKIEQELYNKL